VEQELFGDTLEKTGQNFILCGKTSVTNRKTLPFVLQQRQNKQYSWEDQFVFDLIVIIVTPQLVFYLPM
jgi:hypothetical protein